MAEGGKLEISDGHVQSLEPVYEICSCEYEYDGDPEWRGAIASLLEEGWEPFSHSTRHTESDHAVFFRRKVGYRLVRLPVTL